LTVLDGSLELPVLAGHSGHPVADLHPGGNAPEGEADGVIWRFEQDVLAGVTRAEVDHGSEYATPFGSAREHYSGMVEVDQATFGQRATAHVSFGLGLGNDSISVSSDLEVLADADDFVVRISLEAEDDGEVVMRRTWQRTYPRDLA
jgi:hypothetical protein